MRLVVALIAVLAVTLAIAWPFGATITEKPGAFALAAILMMGLVHLLANAIDERPTGYVIGRSSLAAVVVAAAIFGLQAGTEWLAQGSLPTTLALSGWFDSFIVALVILSFAAVTVLQSAMAREAEAPRWQATYAHIHQGLYVNTIANRLIQRLWPAKRALRHAPGV